MRSVVGAACPFTLRELLLEEVFADLDVRDFGVPGFVAGVAGAADLTDLMAPEDFAELLLCVGVDFADFFEALWVAPAAGRVKPPAAKAARIA